MKRYLALGDSYTIGEGVGAGDRWPTRVATWLRANALDVGEPEIIARTGWTTGELAAAIAATPPPTSYDLVSLLIGVNNQYRGRSAEDYRAEFRSLLERAVAFAGGRARRVVVVSIPDWGATPFAEGRDRAGIAAEIDRFNAVARDEARRAGAQFGDVTTVSREAHADWLAPDGLHPSGAQYERWAEILLPIFTALARSADSPAPRLSSAAHPPAAPGRRPGTGASD